tara:strand:- start:208 stop:582 length:375 start_codon:yes stop_codon:yes gene_type:complete
MHLEKGSITVAITTGLGFTGYAGPFNGVVHAVEYVKSTSAAISSTATLSVKSEVTQHDILTSLAVGAASFVKYPRGTVVDTTNGALAAYDKVPVSGERVELTIAASSVAAQAGTFHVYVEGGDA